jgi:hypothetical protein
LRPTLLEVNTTEASRDSLSSGSRVLVSMKVALTLMCITRMKLSPDNCSIGVRGPMIEALFSRPSRRPNSFDHRRQLVVLMGQGGFQVERDHRGLRMAGRFDFVVDLSQIGFGLAQHSTVAPWAA